MGSLIHCITGTKTVVFGVCQMTKAAAGKAMHALRTWHSTRFSLASLAGRLDARRVALALGDVVGVPSAALSYAVCANGQRPRSWRQRRPGSVPVRPF